jgi:hypothetical protein
MAKKKKAAKKKAAKRMTLKVKRAPKAAGLSFGAHCAGHEHHKRR